MFNELLNRYGAVKRARGCFLYTAKGIRITDLYQEGGRAILGWEGSSAFTIMKNIISRGQTGSFICETSPSYRLQKAVSDLFSSDRTIREYNENIWHLQPLNKVHEPAAEQKEKTKPVRIKAKK